MIRGLMHGIYCLQAVGRIISVRCVPSHVCIEGNELADTAETLASERPEQPILINHSRYRSVIRNALVERWIQRWKTCRDKLREIIPVPWIWTDGERCKRRDRVAIKRVRIGHTLLTHGYLMNDDVPDVAPHCELCNNVILTVQHIMLECEQL